MKSEVQGIHAAIAATVDGTCLGWLVPQTEPCLDNAGVTVISGGDPGSVSTADISDALLSPLWGDSKHDEPSVLDTLKPGRSICLVVSDHTRKIAADRTLPVLIDGLTERGCSEHAVSILIASGIHRHPEQSDIARILGPELAGRFAGRIHMHDPDDDTNLVEVGTTGRGHPVRINRRAVEADHLILLGGVVYHYHAGFGGGRKSLVPGLASRDTIAHNHSMTLDPDEDRIRDGVGPGLLDNNPVAEEMLESARMCQPDFIVNTVLTPDGELAGLFAGDLDAAHRAACKLAADIYRYELPVHADMVIASAGTASNWVQSHKALYNANRAVSETGQIVLAAPCPEGLGDERFRYWLTKPDVADVFNGLRANPEVLGQTALSTRGKSGRTILATGLSERDCSDLGMEGAPDLGSALGKAMVRLAEAGITKPTYYVMPHARYTVPFVSR